MNLVFPQWQGSGKTCAIQKGALAIRDILMCHEECKTILVDGNLDIEIKNNIFGYEEIKSQLSEAYSLINQYKPEKIFTIGGGCDVEIVPVSYLNEKFEGDLTVIWIDAHGDLNTPDSSPSKLFHGMPLRTLLGEGDKDILEQTLSNIMPDQLIMIGIRDLDPPETDYINEHQISVVPPSKSYRDSIFKLLDEKNTQNVYIHIDLDALDPKCFSSVLCPTEGGLLMDNLLDIVEGITAKHYVVGMGLLEYTHETKSEIELIKNLVEVGKRL